MPTKTHPQTREQQHITRSPASQSAPHYAPATWERGSAAAVTSVQQPLDTLSPQQILGLQRTVGNRAVAARLRGRAAGQMSAARSIQRFPFTIRHLTRPLVLVARWESPHIVLYRHGVEVGYLKIKLNGTVWGLKDIIVHDPNMRGNDLGTVLVYFFARLAAANGATGVEVLLPNGQGLYQRSGFVITPNQNPNNPPTITGVAATVRDTAYNILTANYTIQNGVVAAQPAPVPNPPLINNNVYGNPAIGNDDL